MNHRQNRIRSGQGIERNRVGSRSSIRLPARSNTLYHRPEPSQDVLGLPLERLDFDITRARVVLQAVDALLLLLHLIE